jgi:hypothetical protein
MGVTRVDYVGLGDIGGPRARWVAGAGFPLTIWARRRATVDAFADLSPSGRKLVDNALLTAAARQSGADPGALVGQADRFLERSPE